MDFSDKFNGRENVIFNNLPQSHSHLNGMPAKIIDREFRGWSKWFYKIEGYKEWFQEGCLRIPS